MASDSKTANVVWSTVFGAVIGVIAGYAIITPAD